MDWIWLIIIVGGIEECIRISVQQAIQQALHGPPPPPRPRVTVIMWIPLIVAAVIACVVLSYK